MTLELLYVGAEGGTCEQRARALRGLGHRMRRLISEQPSSAIGGRLFSLGNRLGRPPDLRGANRAILQAAQGGDLDVLWIDKGRSIRARTLATLRKSSPRTLIIAYSPDDMMNPANQSVEYLRSLPLYDLHVTTKSYNVAELRARGAREVLFVDNAYDPETHRPMELSAEEQAKYGADVGFVGAFEPERAEQILRMARSGIAVDVWGPEWDRLKKSHQRLRVRSGWLEGLEYARAINAVKINLGFLRKVNRDLQTTRSVEIPACGGFLLAERTDEHRRLFEEGKQAEYFGGADELVEKCRYYLSHEEKRQRIAAAGRQRCIDGHYSNAERLAGVLDSVAERIAGGRRAGRAPGAGSAAGGRRP